AVTRNCRRRLPPQVVCVEVIAPYKQMRNGFQWPEIRLGGIRSARRLDSSDRSDLIGCAQGRVKGEVAALAVDDYDAGADLLYQFVVCALPGHVIRGPTGHALLHELVKRADRKLRVRPGRSLWRFRRVRVQRSDAKEFPGLLLCSEERLAFEDLRIARPRGPAALYCVRDVHIVAGLQEVALPTGVAVRLRFPGDAREAPTVDHKDGIPPARADELHPLHVHLFCLEVSIRVDAEWGRASGEYDFSDRQAEERNRATPDVHASDI